MGNNNIFKIFLACLFLIISVNTNANEELSTENIERFNADETKLDGAAIELFLKLRDKYGQRLRTIGSLIFCGQPEQASKIQPTKFELLIETDNILDDLDLSQYGIVDLTDKQRLSLYRRVVTASSVYIFSADENSQLITKILPNHKESYCKTTLNSYNEILRELNK